MLGSANGRNFPAFPARSTESERDQFTQDTKLRVKMILMQHKSVKLRDAQTVISGFSMGSFPMLLEESLNLWQQSKT